MGTPLLNPNGSSPPDKQKNNGLLNIWLCTVYNTNIVLILNCEVKIEGNFYFEVPVRDKVYMLKKQQKKLLCSLLLHRDQQLLIPVKYTFLLFLL